MCVVCACVCIYMVNAHFHEWQKWCQVACSVTLCRIPFRQAVPELEVQCCKGDTGSACLCLTVLWLKACMPYFAFYMDAKDSWHSTCSDHLPNTVAPLIQSVYILISPAESDIMDSSEPYIYTKVTNKQGTLRG